MHIDPCSAIANTLSISLEEYVCKNEIRGIDKGPHKWWNMQFNSMQSKEPYHDLTCSTGMQLEHWSPPIAWELMVSCSISLPDRGSFHPSLTILLCYWSSKSIQSCKMVLLDSLWISCAPMLLRLQYKLVMLSAIGLLQSRMQYSTTSPSSTTFVLPSHNPISRFGSLYFLPHASLLLTI